MTNKKNKNIVFRIYFLIPIMISIATKKTKQKYLRTNNLQYSVQFSTNSVNILGTPQTNSNITGRRKKLKVKVD